MNILYAQSGGVTGVINSSAYGVIKRALHEKSTEKIYVARDGLNGILTDNLFDLSDIDEQKLEYLKGTPSSAFGSCRKKITSSNEKEYLDKIFETFEKYKIDVFFYNGGNDSMDTANKIYNHAGNISYDIKVIGIPKTVDNDLYGTDHTPGYGSAARMLSLYALEGSLDVRSMARDSTKVFILETMGRHAGWLAASTVITKLSNNIGPHIILVPEDIFDEKHFLEKVLYTVNKYGYCSVVASEGITYNDGTFVSDMGYSDNFGNKQLGNVGNTLSKMIYNNLKLKVHTAVPDYLQRSGGHILSLTDVNEAVLCGSSAVDMALQDITGKMVTIERISDYPYKSAFSNVDLSDVANNTKLLPKKFIDDYFITDEFIKYVQPLIYPEKTYTYNQGIPQIFDIL